MRVRKNWVTLTETERQNFLQAVVLLKDAEAFSGAGYSRYDMFVLIHFMIESVSTTGFPGYDAGHGLPHFLAWHRKFLLDFEDALNDVHPGHNIAIPYWDWTDTAGLSDEILTDTSAALGVELGLSPNGGVAGGGGAVRSGFFAFDRPGTGTNPTTLPGWWPASLPGWRIRTDLDLDGTLGASLVRDIGTIGGASWSLPNQAGIVALLGLPDFVDISGPVTGFWVDLEGGVHADGHNQFSAGGLFAHMSHMYASVNDPMFWLHHSNVDRMWAMYQRDGHMGATNFYLQGGFQWTGSYGSNPGQLLFPWVGTSTAFTSAYETTHPTVPLPDFSTLPAITASELLDHRTLGYAYDTEPFVGLALDRSGSMTGLTPNPLTGAPPNQPKWDAAIDGISAFLQDAETAYDAGEAYVTAGVETFTSQLGANTFEHVFPGTPYGLIKASTAYSQATFASLIGTSSPGGGTPIAGALTHTETTVVRDGSIGPVGERRYLCILTDGKETAAPLLSTLAEPEFPDTVVFAMGFGIGSGWDGVDYAGIQTIVDKGAAAPTGVQQVFHGEDASVIQKFYSNSVAHAIGFDPVIDPTYELLAGEACSTEFSASTSDKAFMIVVNGLDKDAAAWSFALKAPDGSTYMADSTSPYLITVRRSGSRTTVFLNRNGCDAALWVGRWRVIVRYRRQRGLVPTKMAISHPWHAALPTGALPVRGPVFAWATSPTKARTALRNVLNMSVLAGKELGLRVRPSGDKASMVSVHVFAKTSAKASMVAIPTRPYAGADIDIRLDLGLPAGGELVDLRVVGRMVAPRFSLGAAYADLKTIPLADRKRFQKDGVFDELAFLAEYERLRPGAFPVRHEQIGFEQAKEGTLRARVSQNRAPGVYRVGAVVSGKLVLADGTTSSYVRVLNTETALGIQIDPGSSKIAWHWTGPTSGVVTMVPRDRFGNLPSPARLDAPQLVLGGVPAEVKHSHDFSGAHRLEVELDVPPKKGAVVDSDGRKLLLPIAVRGSKDAKLDSGPLEVAVRVGGQSVPVSIPGAVADRKSGNAYGAGTPEAMSIDLAERAVFDSLAEATAAGFEPPDTK